MTKFSSLYIRVIKVIRVSRVIGRETERDRETERQRERRVLLLDHSNTELCLGLFPPQDHLHNTALGFYHKHELSRVIRGLS